MLCRKRLAFKTATFAADHVAYLQLILLHSQAVSVVVSLSFQHPLVLIFIQLAGIIEQFGKFKRLINPGLNFINPCSEQIRYVDMKINILTPGQNACITKDNVKVTVSSSIAYRITNPLKAYYILGGQLNHALSQSTYSSIRNVIGESILD